MPHAAPSQREPPGVSRAHMPQEQQTKLACTALRRGLRPMAVFLGSRLSISFKKSGQGSPGPARLSMIK